MYKKVLAYLALSLGIAEVVVILVSFFNLREAALSIIFYHKIINFKPPVYQATSYINSLLKTSRNIFLKYCGELWGIV